MTLRRTALLWTALAATLVACGGADPFQTRELPMTRIQALWAPRDLVQTYVIRSDDEWQRVWLLHEPPTIPRLPRPGVDFSRRMVIGVTQGSGPSGCHGLTVTRAVELDNEVQVEYGIATPPPGAICTTVIVPLTDFVVVDRVDKAVSFRRTGA